MIENRCLLFWTFKMTFITFIPPPIAKFHFRWFYYIHIYGQSKWTYLPKSPYHKHESMIHKQKWKLLRLQGGGKNWSRFFVCLYRNWNKSLQVNGKFQHLNERRWKKCINLSRVAKILLKCFQTKFIKHFNLQSPLFYVFMQKMCVIRWTERYRYRNISTEK